jgi:NADPH2:quinone reductase
MPFILRGVSLLGVSSTNCPLALRAKIWHRLASDLKPKDLNVFVSRTLGFEDLIDGAWDMINRKTSGRTLVKIR